ncbi:MAG: DUF2059 domain-containing protein [Hyphomicrobiaceae bacterium]|nr:DUF2059 domain-containing protein [Hyphomicrobiaceae bacterium]MCC0008044.1 DUF2059 domain-containing protein [Hyphomicrobiaceae bacterium]
MPRLHRSSHWHVLTLSLVGSLAIALATPAGMAVAQDSATPPATNPVTPEDPKDPERIAAALELIEVTGAKKQIELMLDVMKQGAGAGAREAGGGPAANEVEKEFAAFATKFQGYRDQMVEEFAVLYAERFTAEELKEISTFYRSGAGAKFISAMPELMQQGAQIGQKYGLMAVRELKALRTRKTP